MDNHEIKDLAANDPKALVMKLLASKLRTAKRAPLSFSQERIWSILRLNPENTGFNLSNSMYIYGQLDEAVLKKSLNELIRRQEILRSIFLVENENPVQLVLPVFSFRLKVIDGSGVATDKVALEQTIDSERKQPFDLSKDLPFRAVLLKFGSDKSMLILILHQIIFDAECWPVVMGELSRIYPAFLQGIKPELVNLATQYADYACWQRERFQGESYMILKEFWRQKYQEAIAPMQLPADRVPKSRLTSATIPASTYKFQIAPESLARLKALAGQEKVSTFVTLLSTLNCLLYMYTGQDQFLIFTSVSAKNRPELMPLIGLFSNLVPLQVKIAESENLQQLLKAAQQEVNEAVAHQDLPFDKITEFIKLKVPEQRGKTAALFQVMFTFRYEEAFESNLGDIRLEPLELELERQLNFQLHLWLIEKEGRIEGALSFNEALFEESTIRQIVGHYLELLEAVVKAVEAPISELPVSRSIGLHREHLAGKRAAEPQDLPTAPYEAPRDPTEVKLVALWQEILGTEGIGIHGNFFELGGHSLNAAKMLASVNKEFNVSLSLADLFAHPTIENLAEYLQSSTPKNVYAEIPPVAPKTHYPLSYSQKRMYILNQLEKGTNYNISNAVLIEGPINFAKLESAIQKLIQRHDSLRTRFETVGGEMVQIIAEDLHFAMDFTEADETQLDQTIAAQIKPFDLTKAPLFRITFIKINETKQALVFDLHHIIGDGASMNILITEFVSLYNGRELPEIKVRYVDYVGWQNELYQSETIQREEQYWLNQFQGDLPRLELPTDFPYSTGDNHEGASGKLIIDNALYGKLKNVALKTNTTLYMILLSAFYAYFRKMTGQEDIIFGTPVTGRSHPDLQNIVGFFLNTLAIRHYPHGAESYLTLLERVKESVLKAYENQNYSFEDLLEKLNIKANQSPLFNVWINLPFFQNKAYLKALSNELAIEFYDLPIKSTKFDLLYFITEDDDLLQINLIYKTKLFKQATIEYLQAEFNSLLQQIAENPDGALNDYQIFRINHELIGRINESDGARGGGNYFQGTVNQSIPQRFEEIVKKHGAQIAVKSSRGVQLTYHQLNQRANQTARHILEVYDDDYALTKPEKIRYKRQLLIDGWGAAEQEKLKKATVFVAGAGGSGSPLIMQLALCGFGTIIVADFDTIDLSNLNRQVLHNESRIGMNKAVSAQMTVHDINPHVKIIPVTERIRRENVFEMVNDAAIIFDNVDDLDTKFILSECATAKQIPHIISSMIDISSYVAIFHTPYTPCFHCLYDVHKLHEIQEMLSLARNYTKLSNPVASPALFASTGFACNEAIKIILGFEDIAYNKYIFFNQKGSARISQTDGYKIITYPFSEHFRKVSKKQGFDWDIGYNGHLLVELEIEKDPSCPVCGTNAKVHPEPIKVSRNEVGPNPVKFTNLKDLTDNVTDHHHKNGAVALLFQHGANMITGIMGVLKAGKSYIPLDPSLPEERIKYILEDTEARVIVTDNQCLKTAENLRAKINKNIQVVNVDNLPDNLAAENLNLNISPSNLAYILYTSGSTGQPKGVMQNHRNVLHFIQVYTDNLGINQTDRLSLFSTYSFDAAVMDIYGALLNGATLHPFDLKAENGMAGLANWIQGEQITIYHSTPTVYRYFIDSLSETGNFPDIRLIVMGGEAVIKSDFDSYRKHFSDDCIFVNGLGPTESTVTLQYFMNKKTEVTSAAVPVGYPVAETQVYLLNERMEEVTVFQTGEIVYQSQYLALGYYNLPDKTNEVFRTNPVTGNGRVYFSGDLGRLLPNGAILYLGRKDFQVKIRGYRIETGEIESRLDKLPEIEKSIAHPVAVHGEYILAVFYKLKEGKMIREEELRRILTSELPEYMIPNYFIPLESIPLTRTGKIDRKALPEPSKKDCANQEYIKPRNQCEAKLAEIWRELLKVEKIGVHDNFFELGGHSLKATALINELYRVFQVEAPLGQIFKTPTIAGLAEYLSQGTESVYAPIPAAPAWEGYPEGCYPLAAAQKRIYFINQLEANTISYNMPAAWFIDGVLDRERVESVFRALINRHESLRTSFEVVNGVPVQRIHPQADSRLSAFHIEEWDLEGEDSNPRLRSIIRAFIRPFDLTKAPLLRVGLAQISPDRHLLMFDMSHIISDGTSRGILVQEFITLYEGGSLPELRVQYKDYAAWQSHAEAWRNQAGETPQEQIPEEISPIEHKRIDQIRKQEAYWLQTFSGELPRLDLPTDYPRPPVQDYEGDSIPLALDAELTAAIKQLALQRGASLFMVLLAGFNVLLSHCTGQDEIIIGTPVAGRNHPDLENIIGVFLNTVALRNHPLAEITFEEFLETVKENTLGAFENQDYQFETLLEKVNVPRDMSRTPLFDIMFNLLNMEGFDALGAPLEWKTGRLRIQPYRFENQTAKFDLNLYIHEAEGQILFNINFRTRLFKTSTVEYLMAEFQRLLKEIVADPTRKLEEYPVFLRKNLNIQTPIIASVADWKFEPEAIRHSLVQRFESQAVKSADDIAVKTGTQSLTYAQLNRKANQAAREVLKQKTGPIAALIFEHGIEMMVGVFGALKAGKIYVPLDPAYPRERLAYMLEDSGADLIITNDRNLGLATELAAQASSTVFVSNISSLEKDIPSDNPGLAIPLDQIAYILYTSGSTGKPKGVVQTHRNVLYYTQNYAQLLGLNATDRMTLLSSFGHDAAVVDVFSCLMSGASLYPYNLKEGWPDLESWLNTQGITIYHSIPTVYRHLINSREEQRQFSTVRRVVLGGEQVLPKDISDYQANFKDDCLFVNLLGSSEASITMLKFVDKNSDDWRVHARDSKTVSLGNPLPEMEVRLLDEKGHEVPVYRVGEIVYHSDYLALGYLNLPEKTRQVFRTDPGANGGRVYHSGDLGKILPNGAIQYMGRNDFQVKIRGYRIELGEIETQLLKHPLIKEAVVVAIKDGAVIKDDAIYLCAYLVAGQELAVSELREYLAKDLPEYMIPAYFVQLEQMPVTPNGKINRRALPEPDRNLNTGTNYEAPRNETEVKVAGIWQEILGVQGVGIRDNFFELGGHSLKATSLVARIHKELKLAVPLRQIFQTPTIAGIVEYLMKETKCLYASIPVAAEQEQYPTGCYPTSAAQKRIYILHQIDPANLSYNSLGAFMVEGYLDRDRLRETLQKLIQRHEAFRTSFEMVRGEPVQRIHPEVDFIIEEDADDAGVRDRHARPLQGIIRDFIRPFDLQTAPLLRVGLVRLSATKHLLLFDKHHIISDGTSMGILVKEFMECYDGKELPELRIQYKDYAVWQNEFLNREALKQQKEYWLSCFQGEISVMNLPADYPRPVVQSFEGDRIRFEIGPELTEACYRMATQTKTTLYMILLAVYNILLAKYTGQEDVVVGSPIAGRPHADLERIIGVFINTLAMRNRLVAGKTFLEFLAEVRENSLIAYENQDYQFEELVNDLSLPRDLSRNPLFDVMFILQNTNRYRVESSSLKFTPYEFPNQAVQFDLTLITVETDGKLSNTFQYGAQLFKRETIERFIDSFCLILQTVLENPSVTIEAIEVLTPAEKRRILVDFNQTAREYGKEKLIQKLIEEQVSRTPNQVALRFQDEVMTYRELDERANSLAGTLRRQGVKPNQPVAIMTPRSFEMIIGILGILKAGAGYLPIDPDYPTERIRYMLSDSRANILLAGEKPAINPQLLKVGSEVAIINLHDPEICQGDHARLEPVNTSRDLAYLIYTSGSTGNPKGVMIEHRAVHNFITGCTARIDFTPGKSILALTTISFDIFGLETLLPLTKGLSIVIAAESAQQEPRLIGELIDKAQIRMLQITPSRLQLLLNDECGRSCLKKLTEMMIGGEALPESLLNEVRKWTKAKIYNMYGPTETTIWSTMKDVTVEKSVNIGTPIANTRIYIVDRNNRPQPVGVAGELGIAGEGLARGYLNRPDLTAEKFVSNSVSNSDFDFDFDSVETHGRASLRNRESNREWNRIYRTGDLARWLPDGNIEFLGRMDYQVKIRGYRIELGEIEAGLLKYEAVKEAAVLAIRDGAATSDDANAAGDKYLCAYLSADRELTVQELRAYLSGVLPEYMIPSYFVQLPKLPLTPNGKVNRKALAVTGKSLAPEGNLQTGAEYEAPRNEMEAKLAEIWQRVFGIAKVGIHDSFYDLGGHSLIAVWISDQAKQSGLNVSVRDILSLKTIARICANIDRTEETAVSAELSQKPPDLSDQPLHEASRPYDLDIEIPETKILPVKLDIEHTAYLHYSLPFAVMLADERLAPWYYEHFINIFACPGENHLLRFDFLEYEFIRNQFLTSIQFNYEMLNLLPDIVPFLIEKINHGYYAIINVDEYYLPEKERYQKKHFVHPSLIYGYRHSERRLLALGFDQENLHTKITLDYDQFREAYENGKVHLLETAPWAEKKALELLRFKNYNTEYPFDLSRFLGRLDDYLAARGDNSVIYHYELPDENVTYGIAVYDEMIRQLKKIVSNQSRLDYRGVHFLAEHKKGIYNRLRYVGSRVQVPGDLLKLIDEYYPMVEQFETIRIKSMEFRYTVDSSRSAGLAKDVKEMIEQIESSQAKERQLLSEISRRLKLLLKNERV